jgi:hypothetical protein
MNVEIESVAAQFLFWEYLVKFSVLVLCSEVSLNQRSNKPNSDPSILPPSPPSPLKAHNLRKLPLITASLATSPV